MHCTGLLIEKDVDVDLLETWSNAYSVFLTFCYLQACSLRKMWMWICLKPGPTPSTQAHWAFRNFYYYWWITSRLFFCDVEGCVSVGYVLYSYHRMCLSLILVHETNIWREGKTVHVVFQIYLLGKGGGGGRSNVSPTGPIYFVFGRLYPTALFGSYLSSLYS